MLPPVEATKEHEKQWYQSTNQGEQVWLEVKAMVELQVF